MTEKQKLIAAWAVASVFTITGILAIFFGVRGLLLAHASESWPSAEATVLRSEVEVFGGGADTHKRNYAEVNYEFSVDGKVYTGDRIKFGYSKTGSRFTAEGLVKRYRKGKKVPVYYMPNDPRQSVLEPSVPWKDVGWPIVGLILLGIAWAVIPVGRDEREVAEQCLDSSQ